MGPGLLGTSLGMAIHARDSAMRISVWARREESRNACQQASWCHAASDNLEEALSGSDLAVLCTPVVHLSEILGKIGSVLPENCLLTDVGSTKAEICQTAEQAVIENFVGSHPIAGSEKSGMDHADPALFESRPCFITLSENTSVENADKITAFWEWLGMRIIKVTPKEHDRILAQVSHLPHLLASALCNFLSKQSRACREGSGQGLRDATRIAAGSPKIWSDIAQQNSKDILEALDLFSVEISKLKQIIANQDFADLEKWLEEGKAFRDSIE